MLPKAIFIVVYTFEEFHQKYYVLLNYLGWLGDKKVYIVQYYLIFMYK